MTNTRLVLRLYRYISVLLLSIVTLIPYSKGQSQNEAIDSLLEKAQEFGSENFLHARALADSARALSVKYNYLTGEAEALRLLGLSQFYGIQYTKALPLFLESYNLFQTIGDTLGMIRAKNNIAITYGYQGLTEKSLEIHRENLELLKNIDFPFETAKTLNNIAVDLKDLGQLPQSLQHFLRAIKIAEENDLKSSLGRYYNNIGIIYLETNKPDSALYFLNKSLPIRLELNDKQGIKNTYQGLGQYYSYIKNYNKAIEYFEMSMSLAKEIDIVYEIASIASDLSKAYAQIGAYKKAYQNKSLYAKLSDSLKSAETIQLITQIDLESAFEKEREIQRLAQEKSEAENQLIQLREKIFRNILLFAIIVLVIVIALIYRNFLLNKQHNNLLTISNKEITQQKEEILAQRNSIELQKKHLQEINDTKDKFFSIIAHDLINPLNGMLSLSDHMIDSILKCDNEDIRSNFMLLRQTIWHTFSLIQNLLQWAQTQTGRISFNPQPTNLNDTIKNNIELHRLKLNEKNLDFRINIDINVSVYVDPNMLNTIIRNLISNAIKFTPENGIVEVQYFDCDKISGIKACKENYVIVSIKDSGIGIEESIIDKLFMANSGYTSYGTNNEKGTGLGLALCKEFIERNNGEIWVESKPNIGSTFSIMLPKAKKKID